jgi:hypothetical protein
MVRHSVWGLCPPVQNTGMTLIRETVASLLRGVFKVALIAVSALFVLAVLAMGLVFVAVTAIRFLLTGRRPTVLAAFNQFNQAAQQFRPGHWSAQGPQGQPSPSDVVDVQAHEVRPTPGALPPTRASD